MYDWQKQAEQYVPPVLPSYNYVCRIPVFIPIQEIGMTVWERQIQSLSFIHESVLSAICFGAKTVNELSYQFGLPEVLVLEIISQLDTEQLAAISAGSIVLTEKGRMALQQQQKVVIMRKQFSPVYINQITGEISDIAPVGTYREPEFGKVYLGEKHQITTEFLRNNFEALSAIYQEGHIENIAFERKMVANAELYRILDIIIINFLI